MTSEDPWAGARTATRDEVKTVFARGKRTCPACGTEQETSGRFCDACGADMTARYRKPPRWKTPAIVILGLALFALAAYPLVNILRDDAADTRARDEQRQATLKAAEIKKLRADSKPVRAKGLPVPDGADPVAFRSEQIADAQAKITADGQARAAAGRLDGDIKGAKCSPYPRTAARHAIEADPQAERGRYDCTAYTRTFTPPDSQGEARTGYFGYPYWLVIEYGSGDLVWCKVTPRAGEGGQSLASVPVPAPCREPAATS